MTRWFEETPPGAEFAIGAKTFDADEIIRFGKLYDPQYFHIDPEAAKHSHFGGLIASGWHTGCVGHRLMVDTLFAEEKRIRDEGGEPGVAGPSPGINAMDYSIPVRPGDTLNYFMRVNEKRVSNSLPGWGLLFSTIWAVNQHGETAYKAELVSFSKLRDYRMPTKLKILFALSKLPLIGALLKRGS